MAQAKFNWLTPGCLLGFNADESILERAVNSGMAECNDMAVNIVCRFAAKDAAT